MSDFAFPCFNPGEKVPETLGIWGWVGPRPFLDNSEDVNTSFP